MAGFWVPKGEEENFLIKLFDGREKSGKRLKMENSFFVPLTVLRRSKILRKGNRGAT